MRIKNILLTALLFIFPIISFANDLYKTTANLNIRSGPGKEYIVSFAVKKGELVELISKDGDWFSISHNGKSGYAHSKYLVATEKNTDSSSADGFGLLFILGIIFFLWLLPILIIMASHKTSASEKTAWILAVIFISWFAWIFYMLLAPLKKKG